MIKSYCDVCGKEEDKLNYVVLELKRRILPSKSKHYGLCYDCFERVKRALDNGL